MATTVVTSWTSPGPCLCCDCGKGWGTLVCAEVIGSTGGFGVFANEFITRIPWSGSGAGRAAFGDINIARCYYQPGDPARDAATGCDTLRLLLACNVAAGGDSVVTLAVVKPGSPLLTFTVTELSYSAGPPPVKTFRVTADQNSACFALGDTIDIRIKGWVAGADGCTHEACWSCLSEFDTTRTLWLDFPAGTCLSSMLLVPPFELYPRTVPATYPGAHPNLWQVNGLDSGTQESICATVRCTGANTVELTLTFGNAACSVSFVSTATIGSGGNTCSPLSITWTSFTEVERVENVLGGCTGFACLTPPTSVVLTA